MVINFISLDPRNKSEDDKGKSDDKEESDDKGKSED